MTQAATIVEPVQDEESQSWTAYTVAQARKVECERLYDETWRAFVLTGMNDLVKGEVCDQARKMWEAARKSAKAAYLAWKRVAYPLHVPAVKVEDDASS